LIESKGWPVTVKWHQKIHSFQHNSLHVQLRCPQKIPECIVTWIVYNIEVLASEYKGLTIETFLIAPKRYGPRRGGRGRKRKKEEGRG
jgi:hypothetical protein